MSLINHFELWKTKLTKVYDLQDLEITGHTWGHSVRLWVESEHRPGVLLWLGSRVRAYSFEGLLFTGEFKTQEWEFKCWKRKKNSSNGQLLKLTKISKTKEPQPGSLSSCVAGNVFTGDGHLRREWVFEMEALTIKVRHLRCKNKNNCQGSH